MPPQQPPIVPESPASRRFLNWKVLLIVIGILIVASAWFYGYLNLTDRVDGYPQKASEIDTKSWQTYRNDKYGFEMNIPKDWKYKMAESQSIVFYKPNNEEGIIKCLDNGDTSECLSLWEMSFYYSNNQKYKSEIIEKINNHNFYVENHDFVTIYKIYSGSNAYGFSISHGMDDPSEDKLNLLTQILSTFRFIQ